ncbi:MAG: hypothetical protein FWH42_04610 [Dehalococcoidia bacterium]|nr:hypothetical protein [Dehalococcoidia bacterium]
MFEVTLLAGGTSAIAASGYLNGSFGQNKSFDWEIDWDDGGAMTTSCIDSGAPKIVMRVIWCSLRYS